MNTTAVSEILLPHVMALRMICRTFTSKSAAVSALPRVALSQLCQPCTSGMRHTAGFMSRTALQSEPSSLLSLRQFNSSTVVRSALTDILQEEIKYEQDNYQPPEVRSKLACLSCLVTSTFTVLSMTFSATLAANAGLPVQEVSTGPPEAWQLTETPGDTHMTLSKTNGSEKLQIDLMVNDQVSVQHQYNLSPILCSWHDSCHEQWLPVRLMSS